MSSHFEWKQKKEGSGELDLDQIEIFVSCAVATTFNLWTRVAGGKLKHQAVQFAPALNGAADSRMQLNLVVPAAIGFKWKSTEPVDVTVLATEFPGREPLAVREAKKAMAL